MTAPLRMHTTCILHAYAILAITQSEKAKWLHAKQQS